MDIEAIILTAIALIIGLEFGQLRSAVPPPPQTYVSTAESLCKTRVDINGACVTPTQPSRWASNQ